MTQARERMGARVRLLPVLMAVAGLALAARVADVWTGFPPAARAQESAAQSRPATAVSEDTWNGRPAEGHQGGEQAPDSEGFASVPENSIGARDPLSMTDEEIELLQALAERRRELEDRAERIGERESLLQAAERRIDEKVAGLRQLQKRIEDLLREQEQRTEAQYRSLVKIYENMRPKDAARIFEELDMFVLLPVVERMKERKTAPILAKMNPEKAKAITTELAQRRELPQPEG